MHDIQAGGIAKKEYAHVSYDRIMHILFHKQAFCWRDTKWKKAYLTSMSNMWLYHSWAGTRDNVSTVKKKNSREVHANSLSEKIIYCIYTKKKTPMKFILVWLFNSVSTFWGLFNAKTILVEEL